MTVAEAKRQLRLPEEYTTDDAYLAELVEAAIDQTETYLGKSLITQKWLLVIDAFPQSSSGDDWWDGVREGTITMLQAQAPVNLLRHPVQGVDSITVYSPEDEATVVPSSTYLVNKGAARVSLRNGQSWPSRIRPFDGVEILYTTGYGDQPNVVPAAVRQALRLIVAVWYENREVGDMPVAATDILDKHKVLRV